VTAADIVVFALCLFVGYWLVSKLLNRSSPRPPGNDRQIDSAAQGSAAQGSAAQDSAAHIDTRATLANWYQILGVRENAGKAEIEAAFKRRMALYPPTALAMMAPERRAAAEETLGQINAAYQLGMRLFR
jgi:DnaJ-domain-containing protein 1